MPNVRCRLAHVKQSGPATAKQRRLGHKIRNPFQTVLALMLVPVLAAAGYALLYLHLGGGLGGAVVVITAAKILGE